MKYYITCTCGQKVKVTADNNESAVKKLIHAMDKHISVTNHPDVPKNLTHSQKESMVRATIKKA